MSQRAMPSRGAVAGAREDKKREKEAKLKGEKYEPSGVGSAWTHNFLNQKARNAMQLAV